MTAPNNERLNVLPFELKIALIIRINQRAVESIKPFSNTYSDFQRIIENMIGKFNGQNFSGLKSLESIPQKNRDICDSKRRAEMPAGAWMSQWKPTPGSTFCHLSVESITSEILWWSIRDLSELNFKTKEEADFSSLVWKIDSYADKYASSLFALTMNESSRQRGKNQINSDIETVIKYANNHKPEAYNYNEIFTTVNESKSGCFIATATYGDFNHPNVVLLRNYRDMVLVNYFIGRLLIKIYYKISPGISKYVEKSDCLKRLLKRALSIITIYIKDGLMIEKGNRYSK